MTRTRLVIARAAIMCALTSVILIAPYSGAALTFGSGLYGTCTYDSCGITVSSSGSLALGITPNTSGVCTTQKDTVSVTTDSSTGYTLSLASATTSTDLQKGTDTLPTTTGTQTSPVALTANTWGYRVDGVGGFGTGPTTALSNGSLNSTKFASIPASNDTARVIATQSTAANPAVTTEVWYGVCADTSMTSGIYTSQITYTAITN